MSPTIIMISVLVAAVLSVLIGQKTKINMGVIAFVFGAIIAIYICGFRYSEYYSFWPTKVMLQLLGISFFFGFYESTGTVNYIASHILYAIKGKVKFLPFVLLIISAGFGYLGISALAFNTLLLPIVVALCMSCNRHPVFLLLCYGTGIPIGMASPLGIAGVIGKGILSGVVGPEMAGSIMGRVYLNVAIWGVLTFLIVYLIFKGWKLEVKTEDIALMTEKPKKATRDQKIVLIITVIAVLFLIVPGLIGFQAFGNKGDIGFVYMAAGIICALFKLGDTRQILSKGIPWGIIILVGGFATLIAVATNSGVVEMLTNYLNSHVNDAVVGPLFTAICGIISIFSDAIGVVIPTFTPVAGGLALAGAVSGSKIVTAVILGGMSTACAPLSTGGAQMIAYMPEKLGRTVFWSQMAVAFGGLILAIILSFTPIF